MVARVFTYLIFLVEKWSWLRFFVKKAGLNFRLKCIQPLSFFFFFLSEKYVRACAHETKFFGRKKLIIYRIIVIMSDRNTSGLVPVKEAALRVKYSPDYIASLARSKKVVGELRGRQWFVDIDSLKLFELKKIAVQKQRKEEMRRERLQELAEAQMGGVLVDQQRRIRESVPVAVSLAVVIISCFLLTGYVGYVAKDQDVSMEALSFGVHDVLASLFGFMNQDYRYEAPSPAMTSTAPLDSSPSSRLIVSDTFYTDEEIRQISDSFSDPVMIEYQNERSGIITPVFTEGGDTKAYQFILVPTINTGL